jgi:hypothetical protein
MFSQSLPSSFPSDRFHLSGKLKFNKTILKQIQLFCMHFWVPLITLRESSEIFVAPYWVKLDWTSLSQCARSVRLNKR